MDQLIVCDRCKHGATLHAADGCSVSGCACPKDRPAIVDRLVELVRDDIYNQYRPNSAAER